MRKHYSKTFDWFSLMLFISLEGLKCENSIYRNGMIILKMKNLFRGFFVSLNSTGWDSSSNPIFTAHWYRLWIYFPTGLSFALNFWEFKNHSILEITKQEWLIWTYTRTWFFMVFRQLILFSSFPFNYRFIMFFYIISLNHEQR